MGVSNTLESLQNCYTKYNIIFVFRRLFNWFHERSLQVMSFK